MRAFGRFGGSVVGKWAALMTGPVISLVLLGVERVTGRDVPDWILLLLIGTSLVVALFVVWLEEHRKVQRLSVEFAELKKAFDGLSRPNLSLEILNAIWGSGRGRGGPAPILLLAVAVRNTGAPSIAEKWELMFTPAGTDLLLPTDKVKFPVTGMEAGQHLDGSPRRIYEQDALYNKVDNIPIPNGGKQTGYLIFAIPGANQQTVETLGWKVALSCRDIKDELVKTDFVARRLNPGVPHIAGTKAD